MLTILKLIKAKWVFKKPSKKKILIYDGVTQAEFIFSKKNYEILHVRYESINLYVACTTLLTFGIKNFKNNYKKVFMMFVLPIVVYTGIDNNPAFYKLKDIYNLPIYISAQFGMRSNEFYNECKQYIKKKRKKLKADHIFVFCEKEKERLLQIIEAKIHVVGSVRNNKFPIQSKGINKKIKSIMFISQYVPSMKNEPNLPYNIFKVRKEKQIFNYLVKFCEKKKIQLNFLSKAKAEDLAESFFRNYFIKGNWIFHHHVNLEKTYKIINKQQMIVFHFSTLGFEALAKRIRCVSFNNYFPIKGNHINYPKAGAFWSNSTSYLEFKKTLNKVIGFSNKHWKKIAKKYSSEILSYDPNNYKIKKILKSVL